MKTTITILLILLASCSSKEQLEPQKSQIITDTIYLKDFTPLNVERMSKDSDYREKAVFLAILKHNFKDLDSLKNIKGHTFYIHFGTQLVQYRFINDSTLKLTTEY